MSRSTDSQWEAKVSSKPAVDLGRIGQSCDHGRDAVRDGKQEIPISSFCNSPE